MVNWLRPFQGRANGGVTPRISRRTDGRDVLLNRPDGWEVDQPWLWWLGPGDGDSFGPFGTPPPGASFDPDGYVSLPAVERARSLICDTLAGLPWHTYRNEYERIYPTPNWIADPENLARDGRTERFPELIGVRKSAFEFWTEFISSALYYGDGYVYVPSRDDAGQPRTPLGILNPSLVTIDDELRWYEVETEDGTVEVDARDIIHLRGAPPYDDGHGQGVLTRNGLDLALAMTVRRYAGGQYSSGIPYGYIKSSQPRMDDTQAATLRRRWLENHGSRRSIAVLNATTDFVPLTITPLDAQLSDARSWSLRDIAMAFGIPPYMLGVAGDTSTYANVEGRHREFLSWTALPWIRKIESTLDAQLPRGTELHINTAGFERAETKARYDVYKIALEIGIMTRDEVRALENLPPLGPEADPSIPNTAPVEGGQNGTSQPVDGASEVESGSADSGRDSSAV